ncbi:uncharacterized protein LOC105200453 [Solenopsis invicta]|uniref:uncharacterized protein LOC105200453 n=1 Tax=Solenopsis invicta TaxID=13686 RepID=UPI0005960C7E|nr:uncharacterized protein LOC105200453 [Solenopsis invicta]XP_039306788.1 uncharacterized protein LOC105200453 [Solenopsis invicta]
MMIKIFSIQVWRSQKSNKSNLTGKMQPRVTVALERLGHAEIPEQLLVERQRLEKINSDKANELPSGQPMEVVSNQRDIPGSSNNLPEPPKAPANTSSNED